MDHWIASSGFDWSSGDYGLAENTSALLVPLGLDIELGTVRLSAATSYAVVDGPADITLIDGGVGVSPRGGAARASADEQRRGFTDLSLSAAWTHRPEGSSSWWGLSAGVTLPTAGEGLGSSDSDVFLGGQVGHDAETFSIALSAGYRITGDAVLDDSFSLGASISRRLGGDAVIGVGVEGRQAFAPDLDDQAEIFLFAGRPISARVRLDGYLLAGLTDASPDFGAGLTFRITGGGAR